MLFATQALRFLAEQADRHGFRVEATTDWNDLNDAKLAQYQMVVWLNDFPGTAPQRAAFEKFMENGGAWLGCHVSAYTDKNFKWTWFRNFIGAGVFGINNWPPLPAKLIVDDTTSPITKGLPSTFVSPTNEWYSWRPSPRLAPDIHVLLTMDPSNYPLGIKSMITDKDGDVPVVWSNTRYRMIYMNMGHGDKVFLQSPPEPAHTKRDPLAAPQKLNLCGSFRYWPSACNTYINVVSAATGAHRTGRHWRSIHCATLAGKQKAQPE